MIKKRIDLIDYIRGISILSMVLYHLYYDLNYIFTAGQFLLPGRLGSAWQVSIGATFVFFSGFSSLLSKNNLKRAAKYLVPALLITFVSMFIPGQQIWFGVLHFLGVSAFLCYFLLPLLKKIPYGVGFVVSAIIFVLTYNISYGYIGIAGFRLALPSSLYNNALFVLGFYGSGFHSADYYPLLPWLFLYIGGVFGGLWYLGRRAPICATRSGRPRLPALAWIGRHTLLIYLVHQPVIYLLLSLLYKGAA